MIYNPFQPHICYQQNQLGQGYYIRKLVWFKWYYLNKSEFEYNVTNIFQSVCFETQKKAEDFYQSHLLKFKFIKSL